MRREEGMSLIELMVGMSLLLVALLMFGSALYITQRSAQQSSNYSIANDAVHLAMQDIDRQLRSGYVVNTAQIGAAAAGRAVRIYTEATGSPRCVAWALAAAPGSSTSLALYTASWAGNQTLAQSGITSSFARAPWRMVTDGLTLEKRNADGTLFSSLSSPFSVDTKAGNLRVLPSLDVTLWLLASPREGSGDLRVIEVASSFTSRDVPRTGETVIGAAAGTTKGTACA